MKYYTVGPFLFEYDEERLQGDMIVERAIAKNILPKTLDCNAGAMQALHILPILYSGRQYNFCNPKYGIAHKFPKPFLYLLGLKVSGVMVNHIQDTVVVLNKQLDGVLILKHELVGNFQSCLTI